MLQGQRCHMLPEQRTMRTSALGRMPAPLTTFRTKSISEALGGT